MPIVLDGSLGVTTPMYNGTITANAVTPSVNMKNRIINGNMSVDQRNAGASVTPSTGTYTLDRWRAYSNNGTAFTVQQSSTAPVGFVNSMLITSTAATSVGASDYYFLQQRIEGFNTADLNWGSANAKTITISFWVRSSLTGTFGGALGNNANNRAYPFTYTISSANTYEYKTVTIAGDTTGTWATDNSTGISLVFDIGSGANNIGTAGAWAGSNFYGATGDTKVVATNGATFYITGVQLEVGSTATSFDYRPYGTELALCKRYYDKTFAINTAPSQNAGRAGALECYAVRTAGATGVSTYFRFSVPMRTTPSTVTFYNPSAANGQARNLDTSSDCSGTLVDNINEIGGKVQYQLPGSTASTNIITINWSADAEL
jgi:hypothetical protein